MTELPSGKNLARVALEDYIAKAYAVERHIKPALRAHPTTGNTNRSCIES